MALDQKALLIGINYIGTKSELRGCINDVANMKLFLIQYYGFDPKNIITMTETSNKKYPSRANIIKYMNWLIQGNTENSRLFLHYSGHGCSTLDLDGDERDHRDETICPADYAKSGLIIDDELRKILVEPLLKDAKLTCLFDCCHSGSVLDLRYNYKASILSLYQSYTIDVDEHYPSTPGNVLLLSGCKDKQTSADAYEAGEFQGAMTYCLIETIKKLNKKNKKPTIKNVIKNLTIFLKLRGYRQTAQLSTSNFTDLNQPFDLN